jgi:hypothetical protein
MLSGSVMFAQIVGRGLVGVICASGVAVMFGVIDQAPALG